jgi:hypothetical protein
MNTCAIDVHHHYVPESLLQEAKVRGRHLGVELIEKDGQRSLSFAGGPPFILHPELPADFVDAKQWVKDCERLCRLAAICGGNPSLAQMESEFVDANQCYTDCEDDGQKTGGGQRSECSIDWFSDGHISESCLGSRQMQGQINLADPIESNTQKYG